MVLRPDLSRTGSSLLFLLIIIAIIGGGTYLLFDYRKSREAETRAFANEIVQRLAVQHDLKYLHSIVPDERRADLTPGREESFINGFKSLGVAQPGWQLQGDVMFDDHFFAPHAVFKAILTYPERHATIAFEVSCPRGLYQLNALSLTWERTPEESDAIKR